MGWFEDQVKQRKKLDEQTFEESFMSLAGIRVSDKGNLTPAQLRENYAISQILSYYHHPMVEIPSKITDFKEKVSFALKSYDVLFRKVELTEEWIKENNSPLLVFTKKKTPVAFLPRRNKGYYFINYTTGKKIKVDEIILDKLEVEAYSFYRPLPGKKISIKEYIQYIRKSVRISDVIFLLLVSVIASGVGLLIPYLTKQLTGNVVQSADMNKFILMSIYVVSAAFGLLIVNAVKTYFNTRISIKISKSVQEATMMRILSFPTSFFKKYNTGELTVRFSSVLSLTAAIMNGAFVTMLSVIISFAYLFQLIGFAPVLILPVVFILLVTSGFTIFMSFIQKGHTSRLLAASSKEAGVTYEMINGIQKIRLSGSEKRVFAKWASVYSKSARIRYRPPLIIRLSPAISFLITLLGNIAIYTIAVKNNIDASSYMAFVSSYGVLSGAFASLTQVVGLVSTTKPLFEMARPILETEPEVNEGKITVTSVSGNITLENLSFKYNENGPLIVNNLSLNIKEGEYIAIVGKTGCGKSTLVRLLLGFEKPDEGRVLFDGVDINDVDVSSLRKYIGTVMQNGNLFHADILSNIIISSPNLSEKEAWEAAEIANIANDIREMPMGMKTVISEGQGGISGGQKQRIMIARAIVHKPKILVFDEATSALDNKTQKSITESINKLNCTRIVIAHRLSTIQNADRIIMLEGGKIIEEGNYQSLIEKKGKFAELVERQRLDK